MRLVLSLFVLLLMVAAGSFAQSKSGVIGQEDPAATGQSTQISGCLQGAAGNYRLVRGNGTVHMLMGDDNILNSHVGDQVTLVGYRDHNRDASASGDEGTVHGLRFFQVDSVAGVNGKCGQK
jgi:hypothetical protein